MSRENYMIKAQELFDSGKIDAETYDAMIMNIDEFCDEE